MSPKSGYSVQIACTNLISCLNGHFLTACYCSFQREDSSHPTSIVSVWYHVTSPILREERDNRNTIKKSNSFHCSLSFSPPAFFHFTFLLSPFFFTLWRILSFSFFFVLPKFHHRGRQFLFSFFLSLSLSFSLILSSFLFLSHFLQLSTYCVFIYMYVWMKPIAYFCFYVMSFCQTAAQEGSTSTAILLTSVTDNVELYNWI